MVSNLMIRNKLTVIAVRFMMGPLLMCKILVNLFEDKKYSPAASAWKFYLNNVYPAFLPHIGTPKVAYNIQKDTKDFF